MTTKHPPTTKHELDGNIDKAIRALEAQIAELLAPRIAEQERGGDLCSRCGRPIEHDEPQASCDECGEG